MISKIRGLLVSVKRIDSSQSVSQLAYYGRAIEEVEVLLASKVFLLLVVVLLFIPKMSQNRKTKTKILFKHGHRCCLRKTGGFFQGYPPFRPLAPGLRNAKSCLSEKGGDPLRLQPGV